MKKSIFAFLIVLLCSQSAFSQWTALGGGITGGRVKAVAVYHNRIYAGGSFATPYNHVAVFNESNNTWSTAGNGLSDTVNSLVVFNDRLYAGGHFTSNGSGTACKYIAYLDTTQNPHQWVQVHNGFNNFLRCLYTDGTDLYAGGVFNGSTGASGTVTRIAKYSTAGWVAIGTSNVPGPVDAICKYQNKLYVGMAYPASPMYGFDGTSWNAVTLSGVSTSDINAMAVFQNFLYIAGPISGVAKGVVKFNGSSVSVPINTVNSDVYALLSLPFRIIGGGAFTASTSTMTSTQHFFSYDGSSPLTDFGYGFNGNVLCFANFRGYVIAAGTFTTAGGTSVNNIARSSQTIDVPEINDIVINTEFYPNPMVDWAEVRFTTKEYLTDATLRIVDLNGRIVRDLTSEATGNPLLLQFRIEREAMAAGTYFYSLIEKGSNISTGKFIVE